MIAGCKTDHMVWIEMKLTEHNFHSEVEWLIPTDNKLSSGDSDEESDDETQGSQ